MIPDRRTVRSALDRDRLAALLVSVAAGLAVLWIALRLFPYHSVNHDEAVYLQQAALLLDGQLQLFAGDLAGAFRPWFFVEDGGRLYPKYAPVPAAMYAVSMGLFGEPRVTLAVVAAGNAALVYALGAMVFDRRVGVVAAAVFAASPMALFTSSVFLPYAPTTFLNLAFAVSYLHGVRTGSTRSGALAGVAIGLAAFARPYTALLFAAPFVAHAAWSTLRGIHQSGAWPLPDPARRNALTAAGGVAFVAVALAYNAHLTGSPLVFPYEAFAPLDGPGFGHRQILDHSVEYTPDLALRANRHALQYLLTRWFTAGLLGTACAVAGLVVAARRWLDDPDPVERTATPLLAGLFVSVPLGNVPFWGNYNVLGTLSDPTDGLVAGFGPFYHFDLLVPLSIFAAVAVVTAARWLLARARERDRDARIDPRVARTLVVAALLGFALLAGVLTAPLVATPLEDHADYTGKYEAAYEPVENHEFDNGLVFVPTPYGDWLNHPFQSLRNDPGLDGPAVHALDRGPAEDFAVLDAHPDRTYYRYAYRGEWTPDPDRRVAPKLEPLAVRSGPELRGETVVGVPDRVDRARVRLSAGGEETGYTVEAPGDSVAVEWSLDGDGAHLDEAGTVALDPTDELALRITLVAPDGSTFTYRQVATVRTGDRVEAVWPPERSVCRLVVRCGNRGTYLPDSDAHRDWVTFETRLRAADR